VVVYSASFAAKVARLFPFFGPLRLGLEYAIFALVFNLHPQDIK
jgi:hypothetical protein